MMDLHKKSIPHKRDRLFDCRSSTKTAHETSTTYEVEWLQSTVCRYLDVVPPPGLSKKRAIAKLIGNSLRRICSLMCVLCQNFTRAEPKG